MGRLISGLVVLTALCVSCSNEEEQFVFGQTVTVEAGTYEYQFSPDGKAYPIDIPALEVDVHEVTLAEFAKFVSATGYVTTAEKVGGSYVLSSAIQKTGLDNDPSKWWEFVKGKSWRDSYRPEGEEVEESLYPVTHVSYADATAYCAWAGKRLPYAMEWQYIRQLNGEVINFNRWEGAFPYKNRLDDGFEKTAPVNSFQPGKLGIHNMQGNVWEWCADYYHANWEDFAKHQAREGRRIGAPKSYDPINPHAIFRVISGGSYLCADNYCRGYAAGVLNSAEEQLSYEHLGFRCVKDRE